VGDIAQDAERHSGSAAGIDRIADPLRRPFQGVGDLADRCFLLNGWINSSGKKGGGGASSDMICIIPGHHREQTVARPRLPMSRVPFGSTRLFLGERQQLSRDLGATARVLQDRHLGSGDHR
jgi:hypothetical protein